jgi:putative copper export protein
MPYYYLTVTVHVLAALVWLGGMFVLALVAPILRTVSDDAIRQRLFQEVGERFRTVGWICIAVLVATGILQLHFRGWWGMGVWTSPGFWSSRLGHTLAAKLTLVVIMVLIQAVHDLSLGPKAGRVAPGTPEARALRRRAALLARINTVLGVVLVYFAVRLARGG